MKRTLIILALVGLALLAWAWMAKGKKAQASLPSYQPVKVERGDLSRSIKATGLVQPQNRLVVKPPVGGRVEEVLVREGQWVKRGQVLALMSSDERAALLDAARGRGPEELARWEKLLRPAPLLAPLSGTVIARNIEPGQSASTADGVLVLADRLIVKAQVDETDIGKVRLGQDCSIVLDAYPEEELEGRVDHIAYEAKTVSNVTIYEVEVLPLKVPPFMRSGMTSNVEFEVESREQVLMVPNDALVAAEGKGRGQQVLVPNPKDPLKPGRVDVELGMSDGRMSEVKSGLKEGETVLVQGLPALKGGPESPFMMKRPQGPRRSSGTSGQRKN